MAEVDMVKLGDWVSQEQEHLWYDLENALRLAYSGAWSGAAASISVRLYELLRTGCEATPWTNVPWLLTRSGLYLTLLELSECDFVGPTTEELVEVSKRMFPYISDSNLALRRASIEHLKTSLTAYRQDKEK